MGGFFGVASKNDCVRELFYGTDYHSHLGTMRGGMAVLKDRSFKRSIHNIENAYFRNKFEPDLAEFEGNTGIGVISDTDAQPLVLNSHLGRFGIVTVSKINNTTELAELAFKHKNYFTETSGDDINPTELVAVTICEQGSYADGLAYAQEMVKGSCSILLRTEQGIYASRDKLGRTPIILGKKDSAYAVSSESCAFLNLGYVEEYCLGPGEIVLITPGGVEHIKAPGVKMQVCSFLWVYYGYPTSN